MNQRRSFRRLGLDEVVAAAEGAELKLRLVAEGGGEGGVGEIIRG